jgi:hypothetical protein
LEVTYIAEFFLSPLYIYIFKILPFEL